MSLRTRLLLAFMAIALVPTAIFAVFTLDQLGRSTERWFRPGVDRALESGVEVSKTALTRMETTVLAMADACAARLERGGDPAAVARERLEGSGVDVVQFYSRHADGWRRDAQVVPEGILLPADFDFTQDLDLALVGTRIIRSDRGALAAVAPLDDGARAVVAAMWVPPTFFADLDSVGVTLGYYRQLGVVVDVQRRFVRALVVIVGLGLVLLAFVLANIMARQMARPLDELSAAIQAVARGDLSVRVRTGGARELRLLGESFNVMTGGLARARDQLKEAEREAAWREVARRLAHEFKNILTPVSLSIYRLRRRTEAVEASQRNQYVESLDALEAGVSQLTRLAEQFSQYARLPDPRFEALDLSAVVQSAARLHEQEGVTVRVEDGPPLPIRGDSLLLSRAIHNLLLNACEASPAGGVVEVRTRAENGHAVVEILDRGPGIDDDLRERVFEPYISTKRRGSGLGLSLVRDVANQHGGRVELVNREGGGTCARLVLPAGSQE